MNRRSEVAIAGCEFFSSMKEKSRIINQLQRKYNKVKINIDNDMILYSSMIHENEARKFM